MPFIACRTNTQQKLQRFRQTTTPLFTAPSTHGLTGTRRRGCRQNIATTTPTDQRSAGLRVVAKMLASTIQFTRNTPTQADRHQRDDQSWKAREPHHHHSGETPRGTCLTADASGLNSVPTPTPQPIPPGSTPTPTHPEEQTAASSTEKRQPRRPKHHRRFH